MQSLCAVLHSDLLCWPVELEDPDADIKEDAGKIPFGAYDHVRTEHGLDIARADICFSHRGARYFEHVHGFKPSTSA